MTVDEFVVAAAASPTLPSFTEILQVMAEYATTLEEAQLDPLQDPAVLVMGAFIAFHTNADVNSYGGYRRLIQRCADRDQFHKDQTNDAH